MAKGKRKEKRITFTQAQAQRWADELYWKILRMFLCAAVDVFGWGEKEIVDFAARVNWYFDAANKEHTITEDYVDQVLEAKTGLIMKKTNAYKDMTEVEDGREGQGTTGEEAGDPVSPSEDRGASGEDGLHEGEAAQSQQAAA